MNWINGISRALEYIEENLTGEIDFEKVAKEAYSSSFHFQRVFSILCGFSIGDYVRLRKLSLAGEELSLSNKKVLDVAIKYGYDTQESFSRAFTKFHGVSPTIAKNGGSIKTFSKLSVKLILTGGNTVDYSIKKKNAFKIVCKKKQVSKPQGEMAFKDIEDFWGEFNKNGSVAKICKYGKYDELNGVLGICFSKDLQENSFPYAIGVEYNGIKVIEEDFDIIEIPSYTYAVFQCKGKMPEAMIETYKKICTEFFPQSNYEYCSGVEFEVYPSNDVNDPNYYCEVWVAVKEKE